MFPVSQFLLNTLINIFTALFVVRFIYYPRSKSKQYVFSFIALNMILFFILHFLGSIELSLGVGFGLFAIFSVLRYRTETIPSREMSYLFIFLALPMINYALLHSQRYVELLATYVIIFAVLIFLEKGWGFDYFSSKTILYERIDLIRPTEREKMIADLQSRTGMEIIRAEVRKIDFLHDTADVKIYYLEKQNNLRIENEEQDFENTINIPEHF